MPTVVSQSSGPMGSVDAGEATNTPVPSGPSIRPTPSSGSGADGAHHHRLDSRSTLRERMRERSRVQDPFKADPDEVSQKESARPEVLPPAEDSSPEVTEKEQGAKEKKRPTRYELTKRKIAALREREAALEARERAIAEAEAKARAPVKKERGYTLEELKTFRENWEADGKYDLVEKADQEIAAMEAEQTEATRQANHVRLWHEAEADLRARDPDFQKEGTELDKKLRAIMQGPDGAIYRSHPQGIYAAYDRAKKEMLEEADSGHRGRISELEAELKRLNGLTSISGGAPGRVTGGGTRVESLQDFARLSTKDMRKHLAGGAGRGGMPWL